MCERLSTSGYRFGSGLRPYSSDPDNEAIGAQRPGPTDAPVGMWERLVRPGSCGIADDGKRVVAFGRGQRQPRRRR
jgi:hypothetical protein